MDSHSALSVLPAGERPPSVNPNFCVRPAPPRLTLDAYLEGIQQHDRGVLSRAITLLESRLASDRAIAEDLVDACLPLSGNALRVGITGVPGVGKSTFIEALGLNLVQNRGKRLAVLTIDPSSKVSGGSILGDKSRMDRLAAKPNVYIRPSPAGDAQGGVGHRTREAILLCEAAGFDTIFVETVGVGQSEHTVHSMTDCFLLLMLAGAGDELQGIKRGVVEMADVLAVTKADGDNLNRARLASQQIRNALWLYPPSASGWRPTVEICSALTGDAIDTVWSQVETFANHERQAGTFCQRRSDQRVIWFRELLDQAVMNAFRGREGQEAKLQFLKWKVQSGELTALKAVRLLMGADPGS